MLLLAKKVARNEAKAAKLLNGRSSPPVAPVATATKKKVSPKTPRAKKTSAKKGAESSGTTSSVNSKASAAVKKAPKSTAKAADKAKTSKEKAAAVNEEGAAPKRPPSAWSRFRSHRWDAVKEQHSHLSGREVRINRVMARDYCVTVWLPTNGLTYWPRMSAYISSLIICVASRAFKPGPLWSCSNSAPSARHWEQSGKHSMTKTVNSTNNLG